MKARPKAGVGQAVLLRTYGVVFLLVLGLLVGLTVAVYNKTFVDVVTVSLETNRAGNQLAPPADVKLRGMIVGEVREVRSDGEKATLELALAPETAGLIPADVSARLLPKTLFGEKYVDLQLPGRPSAERIAEGDVITQDRTATAIELETVLDNLLPLLRTIQPAKLNATLNALATALEGRGERLGENLELVDGYFTELNPELDTLKTDISGLADVAEIYADAAPDLARMLRNFSVSSRTVAEKSQAYAGFLAGTAGFATTTRDFLAENEQRIIQVNAVGRPTMELLARYSPEYPCLLAGLTQSNDFIGKTFANGELHITLEVVRSRPGYQPGEYPRWGENRGPECYGLPNPPRPWPGNVFDDGTRAPSSGSVVPAFADRLVDPAIGHSGTAEEQRVVDALVAPQMGVSAREVPDLATLLFGPMARGTAVRHS
ncbi:MAG TPA: MCE family protein [Actinomycetes bacterium]|nr:MCE family protein [Actinomycetes bacterium]